MSDKYNFPENEFQKPLLQLFQFINTKIDPTNLTVNLINHTNYQEQYKFKGNKNEIAVISFYFNKKWQFKKPTIIKAQPKEFGEKVIEILTSNLQIKNFDFIKDEWRKIAYEQIHKKIISTGIKIGYIIQYDKKDTVQLINDNDFVIIDMHYNGDGFFSTVIATAYSETTIWNEFQSILNELKG